MYHIVQDAEALASQAQAAQAVLAASQADVEQGCNNLKHLEQLRRMFEGADGNGVDMAKQLIELRCSIAVMPEARLFTNRINQRLTADKERHVACMK